MYTGIIPIPWKSPQKIILTFTIIVSLDIIYR
jgi:hypothetical protein